MQKLRDEFSITTAEELFCALHRSPRELQEHLGLNDERWTALTRAVEAALPLEVQKQLVTPVARSYAKGARLGPPPNAVLDDLKKYTSRG